MSEALSIPWIAKASTPGDLVRDCLERAARNHGLMVTQITCAGPYPGPRVGRARQEACWRLRDITRPDGSPRLSYPRIAQIVGLKDHTSALYGARAHERRISG